MQKLKLDIEALEVQTFDVTADGGEQETVVGYSGWTNCGGLTCLMSLCPDCGVTGAED